MSKRPRGLGAGFAALISQTTPVSATQPTADNPNAIGATTQTSEQNQLVHLPIQQLASGRFQPRTHWDEARLQELADSIRTQGIVQPIVVRVIAPQQYEIIAGERRWRAAKLAGLSEVPAVVRVIDDQNAMAIALIENIQREDLSAIEEAKAIKQLIDVYQLTHEQIAQLLGRSRESISNLLRLLKLEGSVQSSVLDGQLSAGHARALLPLTDEEQKRLAQQAISLQWSVREVEQAVKQSLSPAVETPVEKSADYPPIDLQSLQDQVAQKMGGTVKVKLSASGKGKIEISFKTPEELQRMVSLF